MEPYGDKMTASEFVQGVKDVTGIEDPRLQPYAESMGPLQREAYMRGLLEKDIETARNEVRSLMEGSGGMKDYGEEARKTIRGSQD